MRIFVYPPHFKIAVGEDNDTERMRNFLLKLTLKFFRLQLLFQCHFHDHIFNVNQVLQDVLLVFLGKKGQKVK